METFKDIPGFEGHYKISNLGNVISLKYGKEIILKQFAGNGYLNVGLRINGIRKTFLVHRLLANAFISNPENKEQVNHINGIKTDNRLENLEWCNNSENQIHSYRILGNSSNFKKIKFWKGRFGKQHHSSKPVNQYTISGELIKVWDSLIEIERELGFEQSCLSRCCNGKQKTSKGYIFKYA